MIKAPKKLSNNSRILNIFLELTCFKFKTKITKIAYKKIISLTYSL